MKGPRIAKKILKNNIGGLTIPSFKTYHKATVIDSTVLAGEQTSRTMEQNSLGIDIHKCSWLIFDKEPKAIYKWNKDSLFNKWCLNN